MGSYVRVSVGTWGDDKFGRLSPLRPSGQALWLHLIIGPHNRGLPGLLVLGILQLVEQLRWSKREVLRCFAEISEQGMAQADWECRVVWLPNAFKHDPPLSPKAVIGWWRAMSALPECDLSSKALQHLRQKCAARGSEWELAFDTATKKAYGIDYAVDYPIGLCATRAPRPTPTPTPTPNSPKAPVGLVTVLPCSTVSPEQGVFSQRAETAANEARSNAAAAPAPPTVGFEAQMLADLDQHWAKRCEERRLPVEPSQKARFAMWAALHEEAGGDRDLERSVIDDFFAVDDAWVAVKMRHSLSAFRPRMRGLVSIARERRAQQRAKRDREERQADASATFAATAARVAPRMKTTTRERAELSQEEVERRKNEQLALLHQQIAAEVKA